MNKYEIREKERQERLAKKAAWIELAKSKIDAKKTDKRAFKIGLKERAITKKLRKKEKYSLR